MQVRPSLAPSSQTNRCGGARMHGLPRQQLIDDAEDDSQRVSPLVRRGEAHRTLLTLARWRLSTPKTPPWRSRCSRTLGISHRRLILAGAPPWGSAASMCADLGGDRGTTGPNWMQGRAGRCRKGARTTMDLCLSSGCADLRGGRGRRPGRCRGGARTTSLAHELDGCGVE